MTAESESALFVVPAAGGEPRQITPHGQKFTKPKFSPKADALYAMQERRAAPGGRLYSLTRLARFAWPSPASPVVMTEAWDRSVSDFAIAADGHTVYLDAEDDGFEQLFQISAQGTKIERLFKVEHGGYTGVTPIAGGLASLFQTSIQPPEIVRLNIAAENPFHAD